MQYCVNTAIRIADSTCHEYSHVELFSPSTTTFSFMSPLSKLSSLQRLNRDSLFLIAKKISLFTCLPSSKTSGLAWLMLLQNLEVFLGAFATLERGRKIRNQTVCCFYLGPRVDQQLGRRQYQSFLSTCKNGNDYPEASPLQAGRPNFIWSLFS